MNRSESKYYHTACLMDEAFLLLLEKKEYAYITIAEVCKKAGVNRSTFYLHYESMADLLEESLEFLNRRIWESFAPEDADITDRIATCPLDELYFLSDRYLLPYLESIRKYKALYTTVVRNRGLFRLDKAYEKLAQSVLFPVLGRFSYPEPEKRFVIGFYVNGLMAIVSEWLRSDCAESPQEIIRIMHKCVHPLGTGNIPPADTEAKTDTSAQNEKEPEDQ